ncbi:energy-coupling factor transporter transmembrane protein EcfT [Alicyclobacillus cycloheptanicus]|uniref:Energy-coupling factor transport system permease protein n=1 Tax=Alicyclobacillus cycloheptanicus TaxID=1457 RepID=A0ABT9XI80_9BACL|nr:energy-coupling factor transporter transmembrane component T [Alicyclobacillus cycloheptanicus]MDQ0190019.1 energy-coupling factor transport system permease protein [Alicyclobacillus cycloheptanicus]WDM00078.1 energy-coupling factor transporter transmembrane protein EcfT [Alicyclobacillus cycloheptanicus]
MAIPELSRRITIGQYLPTDSSIHRMDARFKLAAFVLVVVVGSMVSSLSSNLLLLVFSIVCMVLGRIPLRYGLSGIRPAVPVLVILFVFQLLFYRAGPHDVVLARFGPIMVTQGGLLLSVVSIIKFIEIVFFISVLTLSTTLSDLSHALESLLGPLRRIRFPVHESALILTIALRFVPTFAQEAEKLMKAQASRGGDFGTARWWQLWKRVKSVFPVLLPLFLSAMRRAEDLVLAMEARGYVPGAQRTSYVALKSSRRDVLYFLAAAAVCALALWIHYRQFTHSLI